jgi:hypothetical protein
MKNVFLLSFLLMNLTLLSAETIKADFKVEFGIIGEIGVANAVLTKDVNNTYEISVKLKATGLAETLSGGRSEHHISRGRIDNDVLIADYYQVSKTHGSKMTTKLYSINHKDKSVQKSYKRWKKGKKVLDKNETLDYYAQDDLLSLYFNLHQKITDKTTPKNYVFKTVGAEKRKGKVTVMIPQKKDLENYEEALGKNKDSWYAGAIIYQDIFSSEQGELLLKIGNDGITQKAVLKDLILFGDIRAKRIN